MASIETEAVAALSLAWSSSSRVEDILTDERSPSIADVLRHGSGTVYTSAARNKLAPSIEGPQCYGVSNVNCKRAIDRLPCGSRARFTVSCVS